MPYELPNTQLNDYQTLEAEAEPASKSVEIIYAGSGLHKITGATPYITFNRTSNTNENHYLNSTTVNIGLEGYIVRNGVDTGLSPPGSGLTSMMGAIANLKNLLENYNNYNNVLKIKCDNVEIFSASGVRVVDLNFNKSNDNWIQTVPFTATLQYIDGPVARSDYIKSSSDAWNIEPLEDFQYTSFSNNVTISNGETQNPNLSPSAPSASAPQPAAGLGGGDFGGSSSVSVINVPRFKITRNVSANGVPSGTGNSATTNSYLNAKAWVTNQLATAFVDDDAANGSNDPPTYFPVITNDLTSVDAFDKGTHTYNHLRAINFSVQAGTYSVTDTWLAMPSAISYIEEYQIEASTDENHIKTVSVQGEIRGLKVSNLSGLSAVTSGTSYVSGYDNPSIGLGISNGGAADESVGPTTSAGTASEVELTASKYGSAESGWIADVKPYMYRRASCILGSSERTVQYQTAGNSASTNNPIYSKEHPLNVIPISTTETHDMQRGIVSYNYQYNNRFSYLTGVLSENLSVDVKGPADVVAEAFVLGRRLGPVIQNLGSRTSTEQTATLEIAVVPPSSIDGVIRTSNKCPLYHNGSLYQSIEDLFKGLQPYGDRTGAFGNFDQRTPLENDSGQVYIKRDDETWNASQGRFSKTVTWLYQACSNTREHLDN